MGFYGKPKKKKGTSIRLTGLFKASKKRGLAVGSVSELEEMVEMVKRARAEEQGLVFFLWRNEKDEDEDKKQPDYTLYMDVNKEQEDRPKKRRAIEDDDDDEPAPKKAKKKIADDDDDDEVPF